MPSYISMCYIYMYRLEWFSLSFNLYNVIRDIWGHVLARLMKLFNSPGLHHFHACQLQLSWHVMNSLLYFLNMCSRPDASLSSSCEFNAWHCYSQLWNNMLKVSNVLWIPIIVLNSTRSTYAFVFSSYNLMILCNLNV